jgi:alanine racemase
LRPTLAEIDLSAITANVKAIQQKVAPAKIMAVVKADAYGHGVLEVSKTIVDCGVQHLGVGIVEEGIELRRAGIDANITVLSGLFPLQASRFIEFDLEATVYDESGLEAIRGAAQEQNSRAKVHVKVDTGMSRVGIHWQEAAAFVERVVSLPEIEVVGLYTHFASADEIDKSFTCLQLARFNEIIGQLDAKSIHIPLVHAANSAAVLDVPESYFNMVRPGLALYGYYPSPETSRSIELQPALTLKTRVLYVKEIDKGDSVGYGRTFIAGETTRIATMPVGYADGYNRLLSNQEHVIIKWKKYPVAGVVSMDLLTVDIGRDDDIRAGDEVILIGDTPDHSLSVEAIAKKLGTIPYEVTCRISKRVPRVYKTGDGSYIGKA